MEGVPYWKLTSDNQHTLPTLKKPTFTFNLTQIQVVSFQCDHFYINSKDDIVLTGIQDTAGNSIDFGDISKGLDISPSSQNLALSSKGLATISTNV
jgi:hypothetical protein